MPAMELIASRGRIYPDVSCIALHGRLWRYIKKPTDIISKVTYITKDYEFTATLYTASIDIETYITIEQNFNVAINTEFDIETYIQRELDIRTQLIDRFV